MSPTTCQFKFSEPGRWVEKALTSKGGNRDATTCIIWALGRPDPNVLGNVVVLWGVLGARYRLDALTTGFGRLAVSFTAQLFWAAL